MKFCDRAGLSDWVSLDTQHVRAFAAHSHAGGLGPRSIQRRLSAVRSFYEFLLRERSGAARRSERVRRNPAHDVRAPKSARRLPQTLDADQMARLLQIPAGDELTTRDRAIMELLYSSGLRLAELVGLDLLHLDLKDRTVQVLGKGKKARIVPVGRAAVAGAAGVAEGARTRWRGRRRPRCSWAATAGASGARAVQLRVAAWARRQGLTRARAPAPVPPLLRLASARIQRRTARRAGAAGPRRHLHHPDLHSP